MKKIVTLSAAAVLALSLTACDKKTPDAPKPAPAEQSQPAQQAAPAEQAPAAQQAPEAQPAPLAQGNEQGAKDFAKLEAWDKEQQAKFGELEAKMAKSQQDLQAEVQKAQAAKAKPAEIEKIVATAQKNTSAYFTDYQALVKSAQDSLKTTTFDDADVKALADKKVELLGISLEGAELTSKALTQVKPTPEMEKELQKSMADLAAKAEPLTKAVLEAEGKLKQMYMPAPAPQAEQPAQK
ncbi:MAG: hypothetical protein Q4A81_07590 [Pasteurellaceae bacterium]|nr:hypothetical protein [Pasteurellaceae bacterium]